jgi:hypothetical protein
MADIGKRRTWIPALLVDVAFVVNGRFYVGMSLLSWFGEFDVV